MHCHIARHASEGLALQIMEDRELANGLWPKGDSEALAIAEELCGNWTNWMGDCNNQWNGKCNEWFKMTLVFNVLEEAARELKQRSLL